MKILIDIRDETSYIQALNAVKEVIKQGRISKGRARDLFCRATVFNSNLHNKELVVVTNDTKKIDSFVVYSKDKNNGTLKRKD